jgi:ATP-dependent protease Clp ATPase subunit
MSRRSFALPTPTTLNEAAMWARCENILLRLIQRRTTPSQGARGIIYNDEIDKIAAKAKTLLTRM